MSSSQDSVTTDDGPSTKRYSTFNRYQCHLPWILILNKKIDVHYQPTKMGFYKSNINLTLSAACPPTISFLLDDGTPHIHDDEDAVVVIETVVVVVVVVVVVLVVVVFLVVSVLLEVDDVLLVVVVLTVIDGGGGA